jgi:hypothetical protein
MPGTICLSATDVNAAPSQRKKRRRAAAGETQAACLFPSASITGHTSLATASGAPRSLLHRLQASTVDGRCLSVLPRFGCRREYRCSTVADLSSHSVLMSVTLPHQKQRGSRRQSCCLRVGLLFDAPLRVPSLSPSSRAHSLSLTMISSATSALSPWPRKV